MKIAIVTGASSGMGREFVKQISEGKRPPEELWVIARRKERLEELQREVGTRLRLFECDLTKEACVGEVAAVLRDEAPEVMLLANCAGFAKFGEYGEIREQDTLAMIDLNVRALVMMTDAVIPYMPEGASIVEIASTAAFQPLPGMNVYAASKAFVLSYARALNSELGPRGISVTAVCPGWTKTEFFDVAQRNADAKAVGKFPFMSKPEKVVAHALKNAENHREMSVYGIINKGHLFFSKFLPDSFIMTVWNAMR